jgi:thiol-disulfide isomerase/thioredoxin
MSAAAMMLVTTLAVGSTPAGPLSVGAPAPQASNKMKSALDGKLVSIADVAGKSGTLVVFTCNHCPFARAWERRIAELGNGYVKKGVGVILINSNDPAKYPEDGFAQMQDRVKTLGLKVPYVVDATSNVARAFGASVTPEAFLFDAGGKLAYHGTIDDNRLDPDQVGKRYLKDALDAVVAGKPPAVAETKGIGCGIKFR